MANPQTRKRLVVGFKKKKETERRRSVFFLEITYGSLRVLQSGVKNYINSTLRFTNFASDSPFSILLANKAKSIS